MKELSRVPESNCLDGYEWLNKKDLSCETVTLYEVTNKGKWASQASPKDFNWPVGAECNRLALEAAVTLEYKTFTPRFGEHCL